MELHLTDTITSGLSSPCRASKTKTREYSPLSWLYVPEGSILRFNFESHERVSKLSDTLSKIYFLREKTAGVIVGRC